MLGSNLIDDKVLVMLDTDVETFYENLGTDLEMFDAKFDWCVDSITPETSGNIAEFYLFTQWSAVLAIDGEHLLNLRIYDNISIDHDGQAIKSTLAMNTQINFWHGKPIHEEYRAGVLCFNPDGTVHELYLNTVRHHFSAACWFGQIHKGEELVRCDCHPIWADESNRPIWSFLNTDTLEIYTGALSKVARVIFTQPWEFSTKHLNAVYE